MSRKKQERIRRRNIKEAQEARKAAKLAEQESDASIADTADTATATDVAASTDAASSATSDVKPSRNPFSKENREARKQHRAERKAMRDFDGYPSDEELEAMTPEQRAKADRTYKKIMKQIRREQELANDPDAPYRNRKGRRRRRAAEFQGDYTAPWWKHKYIMIPAVVIGVLGIALPMVSPVISGIGTEASRGYELTGGIAATVDGRNISEDTITEQIMSMKQSGDYDTDEKWAKYLKDNSYTPESIRQQYIDQYVDQLVFQKELEAEDIEVSDEQLEQEWQDTAEMYGGEDQLLSSIESSGYDKESYKSLVLYDSAAQTALEDKVAPKKDVTDQDVLDYLNENVDTYGNARKSSHILFQFEDSENVTDEEREEKTKEAQEVLDKINAGEISFEDAVKEYSDDSSASDGGNVGWDYSNTFVDAYQNALDGLDKGQISEPVASEYGIHLIMCTDVLATNADGKFDDISAVPDDVKQEIIDSEQEQQQSEDFNTWEANFKDSLEITVNDMPENVPYNVDMSLADDNANNGNAAGSEAIVDSSATVETNINTGDASGDGGDGGNVNGNENGASE